MYTLDLIGWFCGCHFFFLIGVPISSPVAGVAIGLVAATEPNDPHSITDYKLLTDLLVRILGLWDISVFIYLLREGLQVHHVSTISLL